VLFYCSNDQFDAVQDNLVNLHDLKDLTSDQHRRLNSYKEGTTHACFRLTEEFIRGCDFGVTENKLCYLEWTKYASIRDWLQGRGRVGRYGKLCVRVVNKDLCGGMYCEAEARYKNGLNCFITRREQGKE
jgi:hypothetical protein